MEKPIDLDAPIAVLLCRRSPGLGKLLSTADPYAQVAVVNDYRLSVH